MLDCNSGLGVNDESITQHPESIIKQRGRDDRPGRLELLDWWEGIPEKVKSLNFL